MLLMRVMLTRDIMKRNSDRDVCCGSAGPYIVVSDKICVSNHKSDTGSKMGTTTTENEDRKANNADITMLTKQVPTTDVQSDLRLFPLGILSNYAAQATVQMLFVIHFTV